MSPEVFGVIAFATGLILGMLIVAFMVGSHRTDLDPADEERLDFLAANKMSLDCMADGTTWGVLGGFPRQAIAIGLSARQAIDRARELTEEGR